MNRAFQPHAGRFLKIGSRRGGFLLLEVMFAVLIFSTGIVALGHCVENCLRADRIKEDDSRARRALENMMAQIEAGAVPLGDSSSEELRGAFTGMTLKTTRTALKEKNEKGQDIFGIFLVNLEVAWSVGGSKLTREISFYHYPRQR